jgi:hypothetical protein
MGGGRVSGVEFDEFIGTGIIDLKIAATVRATSLSPLPNRPGGGSGSLYRRVLRRSWL